MHARDIRPEPRRLPKGGDCVFQPPFPFRFEGTGDEALETGAVLSLGARHKKRYK